MKDDERSRATGNDDKQTPFTQRGLSVDTRIQMIEMVQIEDSTKVEALTTTTSLCNDRLELLLTERIHDVGLAKIACPKHDKLDEHWITVMDLSNSMSDVKKHVNDCF